MRKVRLGRSGLMVSQVGFGGIPIQRLSEEDSIAVIRRCIDLGVTFFDTAHGYTTSEERIGRAIAGRRDGLVLATKSGARDAETFREEMALSLRRLGVEHIDLMQFHGVSDEQGYQQILAPGGAMEAAREAQAAGHIGHLGVSSHSMDLAKELVKSGHFETLMFPFNFMSDQPAKELIPLCREHDVGFIAMKPMGGGLLENATVAFKYLRQFADVVPIPGIEKIEEMAEIISVVEGPRELTEQELAEIEERRKELGPRFCRRCGYCQPCEQGIRIPMVLSILSFVKRMPPERAFSGRMAEGVARFEDCIDCGECEARCPYNLPIREMMRDIVTRYREQLALYQAAQA